MRQTIFITTAIIFAMTLMMCNNSKLPSDNCSIIDDKSLPPLILTAEKINLPEELAASRYYIVHDSILVVLHDKYPDPYFVTVHSMDNTFETKNKFFHRGQGPEELLSSFLFVAYDRIQLHDYVGRRIAYLDFDSIIHAGYTPSKPIHVDDMFKSFAYMNDTTILITNALYFKGFGISDSVPEFMLLNDEGKRLKNYVQNTDGVFPFNYTGGELALNNDKEIFYIAYLTRPIIRLCDYNYNTIKEIVGPDKDDSEFIIDAETDNELCFKNYLNYFYDDFCVSRDNVFFKNIRLSHAPKGKNFIEQIKQTTEIFRLDWNGNLIARYKFLGTEIISLSFSENENTLYFTSYDENDERALYKAVLPDL